MFKFRKSRVIVQRTIIALIISSGTVFGQSHWEWKSPLPQGNTLNSATYGNGRYVAVGNCGTVITSNDGHSWKLDTAFAYKFQDLVSVTYGPGQFAAIGSYGNIFTSSDGTAWTRQAFGNYKKIRSIVYGDSLFVAVGDTGVYTSKDGVTWEKRTSGAKQTFRQVVFIKDQFLAFRTLGGILRSSDGVTWETMAGDTTNAFISMTYGDSQFVALMNDGKLYTSTDAAAWTLRDSGTSRTYLSVAYGNNRFVAAGGNGAIASSSDGITWTQQTSGVRAGLNSVVFVDSAFLAVGKYGDIVSSTDGISWTVEIKRPVTEELFSVVYGRNLFAAVGFGGTIVTSPDAEVWTRQVSGTTNTLYDVMYADSQFLAVGDAGTILSSPDAVTWSPRTSGVSYSLNAATYGNGQFIAVGTGFLTSADGITWDPHSWQIASSYATNMESVTYGNSQFVAVGTAGRGVILTSADGTKWTVRKVDDNTPHSVILCGNRFIVSGERMIYSSVNETAWVKIDSSKGYFLDIACYGKFVAADAPGIRISSDCRSWSTPEITAGVGFSSVSYGAPASLPNGNTVFVAVGAYGTIMASKSDYIPVAAQHQAAIAKRTAQAPRIIVQKGVVDVVLPNPIDRGNVVAELFDVTGRKIRSEVFQNNNGTLRLPAPGLSSGVFLLRISGDNIASFSRFSAMK